MINKYPNINQASWIITPCLELSAISFKVVPTPPLVGSLSTWTSLVTDNIFFIVKADLPGLEAKDVNVTITGNLLTIKGEKKKETKEKDEHHHYVERYS